MDNVLKCFNSFLKIINIINYKRRKYWPKNTPPKKKNEKLIRQKYHLTFYDFMGAQCF